MGNAGLKLHGFVKLPVDAFTAALWLSAEVREWRRVPGKDPEKAE